MCYFFSKLATISKKEVSFQAINFVLAREGITAVRKTYPALNPFVPVVCTSSSIISLTTTTRVSVCVCSEGRRVALVVVCAVILQYKYKHLTVFHRA